MTTAPWRNGQRILGISLVVGLLLRVAVLWSTQDLPVRISDEVDYVQLATSLVEHHTFAFPPDDSTSLRPPLYPALVAGIWSVTGVGNLQAVRALQILIALGTTMLVYLLALQTFDRVSARIAASVTWLYPTLIFFNF